MKPPFKIRVLSRNRALAENLAADLALSRDAACTLAAFDPQEGKDTRTLWIVDEAGLINQPDMGVILDALKANDAWQAWLMGDRLQAQPIDRKGSFGAVVDAVKPDVLSTLTHSYRCHAWLGEHDALRAGHRSVIELALGDGRAISATDAENKIERMGAPGRGRSKARASRPGPLRGQRDRCKRL